MAVRRTGGTFVSQIAYTPNVLTLVRLCIIPFIVIDVLERHFEFALFLFMLAGVSDGLDGLLARVLQQRTVLGQYLDPIADKLLLSTLFLVLTHVGLIPLRVTVLVFSRDLGILVVATLLFATINMRDFRPSIFGKMNTVAQILAVTAVLLYAFDVRPWINFVRKGSLLATVVLTLLSWGHYTWLVAHRLRSTSAA